MRISLPIVPAAILAAVALTAVPAFAQDNDPPAIAARIAWLQGNVSVEAQGSQYWSPAPMNYPMTSGDRIYTAPGGRAAIQSGAVDVRIWEDTDATLTNLNEQYEQIGLAQGYIRVRVFSIDPNGAVEVDTPSGAVMINSPGDYRVNVYSEQQAAVVEVFAGTAQIAGPGVNQEVDSGEAVQLYGTNSVEVGMVEMPSPDGLDQWSMDRDRHLQNSVSARYVSTEIPGYDDLDDYGGWNSTPDYGPLWFPRSTPGGWQPYTVGHWAYVAPWGYTWVDDQPWGYAPFHYGRWVRWQGRWGWAPGPPRVRPVYAPAFVAFVGGGAGVSFGFNIGGVGVAAWFPLGVGEPYVPWYHCSPAYVRQVNVTNVNITVIHNVTIVNNYNVFVHNTTTVRTVNQIQVNNIDYVNRQNVVAVNANAMTSGARVSTAVVHLNAQQQQQLVRAPVALARPPVAPPAHPVVGPRANVSRPVARPVLMTPQGRRAATPAPNAAHITAQALPKPRPATEIRPAAHTVVPNLHPASPANRAAAPASAAHPAPAPAAHPTAPAHAAPAPAAHPTTPARSAPSPAAHPAAPAQPAAHPEARPTQPASSTPRPAAHPTTPAQTTPHTEAHPAASAHPAAHPAAPAHAAPPAKTPPAKTQPPAKKPPEKPKQEPPPAN